MWYLIVSIPDLCNLITLKLLQPRGLEIQRTKATSLDCVTNYYNELNQILTKYDLHDKPERIYNVDEKGLSTSHKPP